jgi:hypothetical protein
LVLVVHRLLLFDWLWPEEVVVGLAFALEIVLVLLQPVLVADLQELPGFLPVLFHLCVFVHQTSWGLPTVALVEQSTAQTLQCLV